MNNNARIRAVVLVMFLLMGSLVYYAYTRMQQNISGLVQTVKENTEPDMNLVRIKELWSGITSASNNIRAYTVTRDQNYLVRFPEMKEALKAGLDSLKESAVRSGRSIDQFVKIENLLNRKIEVYDKLIEINYNRVLTTEIEKLGSTDTIADTLAAPAGTRW